MELRAALAIDRAAAKHGIFRRCGPRQGGAGEIVSEGGDGSTTKAAKAAARTSAYR